MRFDFGTLAKASVTYSANLDPERQDGLMGPMAMQYLNPVGQLDECLAV